MGNVNWFIPQKINVGFCNRSDTFTGKLGYVVYFDERGKMKKETSFNNWRNTSIPTEMYDNTPMEGFVINKTVGGYKCYWYGFRKSYIRVFDPRGFEFEITVDNLMYILKCSSCENGELQGKFVYAWDSSELVLMPLSSPDYEELEKLNNSRFNKTKITKNNIVVGGTYLDKSGEKLVYLGRYDYYPLGHFCDGKFYEQGYGVNSKLNKYIQSIRPEGTKWNDRSFYTIQYAQDLCGQMHYFSYLDRIDSITYFKGLSNLIEIISEEKVSDFDDRMAFLRKKYYFSPVDKTKDEYVRITYKEFMKMISSMTVYESQFALIGDDKIACIDVVDLGDGRYIVTNGGFIKEDRLEFGRTFVTYDPEQDFVFDHGKTYEHTNKVNFYTGIPKEAYSMRPVTSKEIYDKIRFVRVNKYLQNGELYQENFR